MENRYALTVHMDSSSGFTMLHTLLTLPGTLNGEVELLNLPKKPNESLVRQKLLDEH